jgi:predicted DNA-binding transcriptional regulator AlpA
VAQLLELSVPSVYRLQKSGKIPPSRTVAGSQRWIYSEMIEYLDECVANPN